jgi:hypothetical protein
MFSSLLNNNTFFTCAVSSQAELGNSFVTLFLN